MNKLLTQKKYWDNVANKKEFTTPFQMELFKKFVPKEAQILDVGCGYGRTLNELYLSDFTNLTGIDISQKMIARGNKQHPHLTEGAVLRHHSKMWIDELMNIFKTIIFEPIIYTTMNGNKSNGLYYMGRKQKNIKI